MRKLIERLARLEDDTDEMVAESSAGAGEVTHIKGSKDFTWSTSRHGVEVDLFHGKDRKHIASLMPKSIDKMFQEIVRMLKRDFGQIDWTKGPLAPGNSEYGAALKAIDSIAKKY